LRERCAATNLDNASSKVKQRICNLSILVEASGDTNWVLHFCPKDVDSQFGRVEGSVALAGVQVEFMEHLQGRDTSMVGVLSIGVGPAQQWRNNPSVEESSSIGSVEVRAVKSRGCSTAVKSEPETSSVTGRRRGRCVAALDEV
jgi:hypothetical protein